MLIPRYVTFEFSQREGVSVSKFKCRDCNKEVIIFQPLSDKRAIINDVTDMAMTCNMRGCAFRAHAEQPEVIADILWDISQHVELKAQAVPTTKKPGIYRGRDADVLMLKSLTKDLNDCYFMLRQSLGLSGKKVTGIVPDLSGMIRQIEQDEHPESPKKTIELLLGLLADHRVALTKLYERMYGRDLEPKT